MDTEGWSSFILFQLKQMFWQVKMKHWIKMFIQNEMFHFEKLMWSINFVSNWHHKLKCHSNSTLVQIPIQKERIRSELGFSKKYFILFQTIAFQNQKDHQNGQPLHTSLNIMKTHFSKEKHTSKQTFFIRRFYL